MRRIFILILVLLVVFTGCKKQDDSITADLVDKEVPESELAEYIDLFEPYTQKIIYDVYTIDETKYYLSDINEDGEYEVIKNIKYSSLFTFGRIECYEPVSKTFSLLDDGEDIQNEPTSEIIYTLDGGKGMRYEIYLYNDELFIICLKYGDSEGISYKSGLVPEIFIYKPVLINNNICYGVIDETLGTKIRFSFISNCTY